MTSWVHIDRKKNSLNKDGIACGALPPLNTRAIYLSSDEAVKFGLSMENRGLEGIWPEGTQILLGKNSLSVLTGKAHKRLRSALIPVFQPKHLKEYVLRMNEIVREYLLKEWRCSGTTSLTTKRIVVRDEMKTLTFEIIAELVLGLDLDKDRKTVKELNELFIIWLDGLFMPAIKIPGSPFVKALRAHRRIKEILISVIEQRRQDKATLKKMKERTVDVMDILLAPTKDDVGNEIFLSNDEIFDTLVVLLFAGSDTSTCNMTWVLKFLSDHPDVLERLREEHLELCKKRQKGAKTHIEWEEMESLRYTNQVIFEVLRLHPPVGGSFRKVTKDLIYKGYLIPKGYTVAFNYQSMTMDPKYHKSSATFNPDRFVSDTSAIGGLSHPGFIPFGGGARMCIGYRMAIAEMNVFIHHMVLDYQWTPVADADDTMSYFPMPLLVDGVPMEVKRRVSVE